MILTRYAIWFLTLWLATPAWSADWPQWRGEGRDGVSSETGLFTEWKTEGPELAWMARDIGNGYASVSVVGDRIYTTGDTERGQAVFALDAKNGDRIWSKAITEVIPKHGYEGSRCTPTVDGDRLYVVSSAGSIVCLSAKDGTIEWSRGFDSWNGRMMSGWGYSESPLVDGDKVICTPGGDRGMVVALDKMTGKDIWVCTLPNYGDESGAGGKDLKDGAGYSSIVVSEGGGVRQYVQLVGRGLIGVRASDGKLLWRYARVANGTANIPTAIVQDDLVFTSTAYGTGSALLRLKSDGQGGVTASEEYWLEANQLQNKHGGMVLVDGYVYCGTGNGQGLPVCAKLESGEIAWGPERGKGSGEASVCFADGHVVMRRDNGTVMIVRATPEKFDLVHSFEPAYQDGKSWAHPVIANGMLYLREQNRLMAYRLKANGQ